MAKGKAFPSCEQEVIAKKLESVRFRKDVIALLRRVILIAIASFVLLHWVFLLTQAHGQNMFPAIKDGDLIIGYRMQKKTYQKDDILVCTVNGREYIGRMVARGGDVVTVNGEDQLVINGTIQGGEIIYPTQAKEGGQELPLKVPDGYVFLMGDYRTSATDSRDFGPVPMSAVKGKVLTILRRRQL